MARYNIVKICLSPPGPSEIENNETVASQKCIFYSELDVSEKYWNYKHETSMVSKKISVKHFITC
jgi:hypothetical protein